MSIDYATVKAARSPEFTRSLAAHETGHCFIAKAVGSFVEYVTIIPNDMSHGHCMRWGVPFSSALNFVDDSRSASSRSLSDELITACEAPQLGVRRASFAAATAHAQILCLELVAGNVCQFVLCPELPALGGEFDFAEAYALASKICATPAALVNFAKAEAETLIRAHLGVVTALVDQLVESGTLYSEQIDQVIGDAVAAETLAAERAIRCDMQARTERAEKFTEMFRHG